MVRPSRVKMWLQCHVSAAGEVACAKTLVSRQWPKLCSRHSLILLFATTLCCNHGSRCRLQPPTRPAPLRHVVSVANTRIVPVTCAIITPAHAHNLRRTPNMSTPRGGRGGERSRGARGGYNANRGNAGRGRGNGAPAYNNADRPTQPVYARGGQRGANRGGAARGGNNITTPRGSTNTRAATRGQGNHV